MNIYCIGKQRVMSPIRKYLIGHVIEIFHFMVVILIPYKKENIAASGSTDNI